MSTPPLFNCCYIEHSRITADVYEFTLKCLRDINVKRPVIVVFVDGDDPRRNDGEHWYGLKSSFAMIRVWEDDRMPDEALRWLIAHELRHVWQSINDYDEPDYEEEADRWATEYTGFDGVAWWRGFLDSFKEPEP